MPNQQDTATSWLDAARHVVAHGFCVVRDDGSYGPPTDREWEALEQAEADEAPEPVGGVVLDAFTASMLVQVHDALRPDSAARFRALTLDRAVAIGWRVAT